MHYQNFEQQKEPGSAVIAAEIECRTTKRVRVQEGVSNLHIALSWFAFGNESLCTCSFKRQRPPYIQGRKIVFPQTVDSILILNSVEL